MSFTTRRIHIYVYVWHGNKIIYNTKISNTLTYTHVKRVNSHRPNILTTRYDAIFLCVIVAIICTYAYMSTFLRLCTKKWHSLVIAHTRYHFTWFNGFVLFAIESLPVDWKWLIKKKLETFRSSYLKFTWMEKKE